ncbi:FAD-dependent oxidoreductase [Marinobacter adhaerens]|jgi:hypothetical protein|uniref:FAD-dependent oxidoreductase n=1 Tax=Marinobacter adhaerens TaxID=1033846 RepID=UPI001C5ED48E|nr:FAD-dependent oxidoreductase [Marinobacter adhaerens]MBW4979599.1 FAD-dependent oxidoreductase [Marinobacter adhaerens]
MSINRAHLPAMQRGKVMGPLPGLAYEPEALAFFAAAKGRGYDLAVGEKYAYNRWYKRMKAQGLLGKVQGAWMLASVDPALVPINLVAPGTYDLTAAGSPKIIRHEGCRFTDDNYFDTGLLSGDLTAEDSHLALMCEDVSSNTATAIGAYDASEGYTLAPAQGRVRMAASLKTTDSAQDVADGRGFLIAVRDSASNVRLDRNGKTLDSVYSPTGTVVSRPLYIGCANFEGAASGATDQLLTFASVGSSMTAAEAQQYYAITRTLWLAIRYGCPDIRDAGTAPHEVEADVVSYGATPGGIVAAYEAARQGLRVALVGGWRDRHLGGMMAAGLNHLDIGLDALVGGLSDWVVDTQTRLNGEVRSASNVVQRNCEPHVAEGAFRSMLDPKRKHGQAITIYWTDGVDTVQKDGAEIVSITTVDGRTFRAATFHDGSYEGDLIARAGVRYRIGREAAGELAGEALNGYNPYYDTKVDPYNTPGDSGSGLIPWVSPAPALAIGDADYAEYIDGVEVYNSGTPVTTQPYNFRMSMTTDPRRAADFDTNPPPGYDIADYELYLRYWEAREAANPGGMDFIGDSTDTVVADQGILSRTSSPGVAAYGMIRDINSTSRPSSDWMGQNFAYPEADYSARATLWNDHKNFTLGLIYLSRHDPSPRVPASLRADAQLWSWAGSENLDPYEGPYGSDPLFFPKQLYVRAGRRLVGELIMTADHLKELVPILSTKTVGMSSYPLDSHVVRATVRDFGNGDRVALDGGFFDQTYGGADGGTPMPVEIMLPKKAECENLTSSFVISATHAANGQLRMEVSSMQLGQAAGVIATIRHESSGAVQDIDYENELRPRLVASKRWYDESSLILTQTTG